MGSTDINFAFTQNAGRIVRDQQDALLVAGHLYQRTDLPVHRVVGEAAGGYCAVADGVASSPSPQRASRAVLEALRGLDAGQEALLQDGWIGPRLIRRHVHAHLCRQLARDRRTRSSASTLALLQWRAGRFSVLNVGDSRVYRVDLDGRWQRLSRDHTYFESMVERGEIARDQSVGQLYHDLEHMLTADAQEDDFAMHWRQGEWAPGDTFLLCTDGLHDTLGETRLEAIYRPERPVDEQAALYREAVLDAGAPDNVSLILARITSLGMPV
ncbi:protein phosphatase 2C domain-containing protein [uncultured Thiodictyon sp.]|uniref:PP2C family protein-serine/threonine phosphatase n=1 Tax=uncultured Thiodictyon sp. TaxID=1846217 RepID=UPI0025DD759D|nr:protein phosphatase 2C domain-containing protein [uncultured Thiodictyon sp.]